MSNTHTGVILEIRDVQNVTEKFDKRQFVVDEVFVGKFGPIHNPVVFTLTQEKCFAIDQFKVGDHVSVSYNLDSRPWIKDNEHQLDKYGEKVYFLDVRAWKIEPVEAQDQGQQSTPDVADAGFPTPTPTEGFDPNPQTVDDEPNDLPF